MVATYTDIFVFCFLLTELTAHAHGESTSSETQKNPKDVTPGEESVSSPRSHQFSNVYAAELWFLGNKMTKVEGKVESFGERMDRKLNQNVDGIRERVTGLENTVLERVASVEADLISRTSRLEDRLAGVLLSSSQDGESDRSQDVEDIKRNFTSLVRSFDRLTISIADVQEERIKDGKLLANISARISKFEERAENEFADIPTTFETVNESVAGYEESGLRKQELTRNLILTARVSKLEATLSTLSESPSTKTCADGCQGSADTQRRVEELERSVERLGDTVSGLLEKARKDQKPQPTDTCQNVTKALVESQLKLGEMNRTLQTLQERQLQQAKPVFCERDMSKNGNRTYAPYVVIKQHIMNRDFLCDTKTDGGGWIVIQKRTNGDVYFNRGWRSYKEGFGKLNGDFWLGNDVVYFLTNMQPYELRIDIESGGKNYHALYKSFKIESEENKYRLRLGSVSGTLGTAAYGLSYSNNMYFGTRDRDNDRHSSNCAAPSNGGWWYNNCYRSLLNGSWRDQKISNAWNSNGKLLHATRTEMKMRQLKTKNE